MVAAAKQDVYNHVVNHVAISVPNLEEAIKFYTEIMGFRRLRGSRPILRKETPDATIFKVYGDALSEVEIAFLASGNGVGIELFEFKDPKYRGHPDKPKFDFNRGGVFHFAVTAPEPDKLCEKMVAAGGRRMGETVSLYDGDKALYCQDPWGTVIEVLSCSFEQLSANRTG